ncbi:MAG: hypothetical protein V8R49_03705 [Duodenibacillus massiliensis]
MIIFHSFNHRARAREHVPQKDFTEDDGRCGNDGCRENPGVKNLVIVCPSLRIVRLRVPRPLSV